MENFANDFTTTLSGALTNVATTVNVVSATGAPAASFRIRVDNEYMLVNSLGSGLNWNVTRGIEGSTPVAHSSGATVYQIITVGGLKQTLQESSGRGVLTSGVWTNAPSIFRLLMTATGTVTVDSRNKYNDTKTGLYVYTLTGVTLVEFPFLGVDAYQIRVTLTGSATAEII